MVHKEEYMCANAICNTKPSTVVAKPRCCNHPRSHHGNLPQEHEIPHDVPTTRHSHQNNVMYDKVEGICVNQNKFDMQGIKA